MRFILAVDNKDLVLDEHQLRDVLQILNNCEELRQVYMGPGKGARGDNRQYADEIHTLDSRGAFNIKPLASDYYDTIKLVAKLAKES